MANTENIRRWVEALRSGRYKQTKQRLRKTGDAGEVGYCCLGVACEISGLGRWDEADDTFLVSLNADGKGERQDGALPKAVQEWLGVDASDPAVGRQRLSQWNDLEEKSFEEIADLVEAKYL